MREQSRALEPGAVPPAVALAEQLVAAADGEQRDAAVDRLPEHGRAGREVGRDHRLLAVLAAADVEEVVSGRVQRVVHGDGDDAQLVTACGGARSKTAMLPRSA